MDEENLGKLLKSLSNCNYVEFVKIFSMIHGFDATFEFCRNALTTIPFMAFKRKFWWSSNNDESNTASSSSTSNNTTQTEQPKLKRQAIRSTWEDENEQSWLPGPNPSYPSSSSSLAYDSDYGFSSQHRRAKYQRRTSAPSSFKTQKKLKFSDLPYEIVIFIFSFFKTTDLLITSLVSHEWNRISFVSTIELNIDNRNDITDPIISKKIYRHSNYLKKIRCASPAFASSSLDTIMAHCRNLIALQFYHCPAILDAQIELIARGLQHVKKFVLHSNVLTNASLESLTRMQQLNELELGGFRRLPLEQFSKLGECPNLRSLDVSGIDSDTDFVRHLATCTKLNTLRLRLASETSIIKLPYLTNLTVLSIAEWEVDATNPNNLSSSTNSTTATSTTATSNSPLASSIIFSSTLSSNNGNSNNSTTSQLTTQLHFLNRLPKLTKFEVSISDSGALVNNLAGITLCAPTLRELDLDASYDIPEELFVYIFEQLHCIESLFLSSFNLSGNSWRAFASLPHLRNLSMCCVVMNETWINTGLEHLGQCTTLEILSIINSTKQWIPISAKSFRSILNCSELSQLRLGGSRGGGWLLDESIFDAIGSMSVLQHLDTSNSRGITEKCFEHLSRCSSLESLECGLKISEETVRNAVAEWCGTGTLVNCPSLKKVVVDVKLPSIVTSEVTCDSQQTNSNNSSAFNLITKLTTSSP